MSNAPKSTRSFERTEEADLKKLAELARGKLEEAFERHPDRRALYEKELVGICLCQGAADHYANFGGPFDRGIHDFDVWAFFNRKDAQGFWNRRAVSADFGPSKFGRSRLDPKRFKGRRIDIFWRAIPEVLGTGEFDTIQEYFSDPQTASSKALSKRPAVLIWPDVGHVLYQPPHEKRTLPRNFEWTRLR